MRYTPSWDPTGKYILCCSEDRHVYIWRVGASEDDSFRKKAKRDKLQWCESFVPLDGDLSAAIFLPVHLKSTFRDPSDGLALVAAGLSGTMAVFYNAPCPCE
mmetsp:Transcript_15210/g.30912  ORF Transcript_15210/g.30912 Transcript_15210/m.30912 type:complete len:102 (-) Transcript_15210:3672-3977(-)